MTDVVEAMARAMWEAFCAAQTCPKNCPSWGELQAQGHQGRHRINEFLGYAAVAPLIRRVALEDAAKYHDEAADGERDLAGQCGAQPANGEEIAAAIRSLGDAT